VRLFPVQVWAFLSLPFQLAQEVAHQVQVWPPRHSQASGIQQYRQGSSADGSLSSCTDRADLSRNGKSLRSLPMVASACMLPRSPQEPPVLRC